VKQSILEMCYRSCFVDPGNETSEAGPAEIVSYD